MTSADEKDTLICLFHTRDHAASALRDLEEAGLPRAAISVIGNVGEENDDFRGTAISSLSEMQVPERDREHLNEGLNNGGVILAVETSGVMVDEVEDIFGRNNAGKIDEEVLDSGSASVPLAAIPPYPIEPAGSGVLPVIEEELLVGKRQVESGRVRVYNRVIDEPVEESILLREEHIRVDRRPVDREASEAEFAQGDRSFSLTESAEEAVVSKSARVVEEVVIGKTATERTENVSDTVRKTQVEVEPIESADLKTSR